MNRTPFATFIGVALLTMVLCPLAPAQSPPASQKPDAPPDTKATPAGGKKLGEGVVQPLPPPVPKVARRGTGRLPAIDRRLAALTRLKGLIDDQIKLTPDQRKKFDMMFDDYMGGLINSNFQPHLQPRPQDAATPQDLPKLQKELADAEKEGQDKEKIASIQAKINAAKITLEPNVVDEPVFFLQYVRKELTDEQRAKFDTIVQRWQALRPPEVAPDEDFKQLRRTTRDPELRDSEELAKKLDDMIVTAIRTIPLGPQRLDKNVMKELAEKTKPKILEILTPAQREHFEKTLAMLKRCADEDPELVKKVRERLKDHRPSVTAEQPIQGHPTGETATP